MSNEKKQTAVDLLWSMIPESTQSFIEHQFDGYKQAKEMEKQQIISDNIAGMEFIPVDPNRYQEDAEQYYNAIYGGNK